MEYDVLPDAPPPRRPRVGLVAILVLLALLAGIALMIFAVQRTPGLFDRAATPVALPATATAPVTTQPLAGQIQVSAPVTTPIADIVTLSSREATLAGQLAALEARTASLSADAAAAGGQATRAEGMLIAFAARRAIDRGLMLGYLEEQLRLRFGQSQPRAVAILLQAARQPVTIEDLRQALDAIAPDLTSGTSDSWWTSVARGLGELVVLRKVGSPSPLPADRLDRARRMLEGGQVEAAAAEVARLPGASRAANWTAAAHRYVLVRRALDTIETAAILGQGTAPQPLALPPAIALPTG